MAWIEAHQTLGQHPKLRKLAALLGVSRPQAVGHCIHLWWWCLDYAQDGCLARYDAVDVALAAEWTGDAAEFVDALERAGFVDRTDNGLRIHDWVDYAGRLIERRKADAERKRAGRPGALREPTDGRPTDVRRTSAGHPSDRARTARLTVPYPTVPNQTVPREDARAARSPHQTQIPAQFTPSESALKRAAELGWTVDGIAHELEKFRGYHEAKGGRFKDWNQCFLNWLRKAPEFAPKVVPIRANGAARGVDYEAWTAELDDIITGGGNA